MTSIGSSLGMLSWLSKHKKAHSGRHISAMTQSTLPQQMTVVHVAEALNSLHTQPLISVIIPPSCCRTIETALTLVWQLLMCCDCRKRVTDAQSHLQALQQAVGEEHWMQQQQEVHINGHKKQALSEVSDLEQQSAQLRAQIAVHRSALLTALGPLMLSIASPQVMVCLDVPAQHSMAESQSEYLARYTCNSLAQVCSYLLRHGVRRHGTARRVQVRKVSLSSAFSHCTAVAVSSCAVFYWRWRTAFDHCRTELEQQAAQLLEQHTALEAAKSATQHEQECLHRYRT